MFFCVFAWCCNILEQKKKMINAGTKEYKQNGV
jgi:hypothetical protein